MSGNHVCRVRGARTSELQQHSQIQLLVLKPSRFETDKQGNIICGM